MFKNKISNSIRLNKNFHQNSFDIIAMLSVWLVGLGLDKDKKKRKKNLPITETNNYSINK